MTEGERDAFAALVLRGRQLAVEIAERQEELGEIKTKVGTMIEIGQSVEVNGVPVTKRPGNRTFDTAIALTFLEPEERKACKVERYDPKALRAAVKVKDLEDACMVLKAGTDPIVKLEA